VRCDSSSTFANISLFFYYYYLDVFSQMAVLEKVWDVNQICVCARVVSFCCCFACRGMQALLSTVAHTHLHTLIGRATPPVETQVTR
jgi:hypothetical protein